MRCWTCVAIIQSLQYSHIKVFNADMSDQVGLHLEYYSSFKSVQESLHEIRYSVHFYSILSKSTDAFQKWPMLSLMIKGRMQSMAGEFNLLNVVVCGVLTLSGEFVQCEVSVLKQIQTTFEYEGKLLLLHTGILDLNTSCRFTLKFMSFWQSYEVTYL